MSRFVTVFLESGSNDGVASVSIDLSRQMTTKELCSRVCAQLRKDIETLTSSSITLIRRKKLRLDGKTSYVETEIGTLSDSDHPYEWIQRSTRENELKLIFRTRDTDHSPAATRAASTSSMSSSRLYGTMRFITDLSAPKNFGRDILLECKHFGYLTVLPQSAPMPNATSDAVSVPAGYFECFLCTNEIWLFKPDDYGVVRHMMADGTDAVGFVPLDDTARTSVVSVRTFMLQGSHNFRVSFTAASNRDMLTWIEGIENRSMLMSDNDLMNEAEAKISEEEERRSALDAAFLRQVDCLEGTLRCTYLRRCFKGFIAGYNARGWSPSQCLMFWIEVERYRCCTSQWQPGSGFPEAYAAWIRGKYTRSLLGVDFGDVNVATDLVGAFDGAQHAVFQHLERTVYQRFRLQPRYQHSLLATLAATVPTARVTQFLWFCDVYGRAGGAAVDLATEPPQTTGTEPWERNLPDFVASARGKKRSSRRSKHNKYTQPPEPPQLPHPASPVRPSSASPGPSEWTRSSLGLWMRPAPSIRSNLAAARVAQQQTSSAAGASAASASAASSSVASTSNKSGLALRVVQLAGELSSRTVAWVRSDTDDGTWERNYWMLTNESLCRYDDDSTGEPRQRIHVRDVVEVSRAKDNRSPENSFEVSTLEYLVIFQPIGPAGTSLAWLRSLQQHPHMRPNPVHGPKALLMEGSLHKMGQLNRQWKRRMCKLFSNGELQYFVYAGGRKKGTLRLNAVIDVVCRPVTERRSGKVRAAFDLVTSDRRWQFVANTQKEMVLWVSKLRYFKPVRKELVIRSPSYR